ncbi:GerMN domain-containing protein [Curtobacterium sp. SP.BCp]|uniref:GerMN domain-containing protein n=1 Tax=Curtobacterium sp. SP.BCp TaxID=3435230 RepID=UPI003F739713
MTRRTAAGRTAADQGGARATAGAAARPTTGTAARAPRRGLRRSLAVALAALTLVALAACAAIPVSGDVRSGQSIKDESVSGVELRPDGPSGGEDQTAVLRGFIAAATGAQNNYATAREFLSSGFSQKWNPRQGVTISDGSGQVERVGANELTYTLTASASVDADGEYTQAVRPTTSTLTFQFVREGDDWRIAYAPDGIILSPVRFQSVFQQHALYFFDPTGDSLVPDVRWFLAQSSVATRVVSALLAGPADWLDGAVVSAFPKGTQLSLNAVTIENGTAQVDLSSAALRASTADRVRMREQLAKSLATVASVSSVTLTVEGASLSVPSSGSSDAQQNPDVDPRPLVEARGKVGYAAGTGSVSALGGGMSQQIVALDPDAVALSASGTFAAVRSDEGVFVVRSGQQRLRVDTRTDLVAPSVDDVGGGSVWVASEDQPSKVRSYSLTGEPHDVSTTLPSGKLVSFQVSRDSTRALALLQTADGPALYVMAIERDRDRVPTALGPPVRVQAASEDAVSATWVSDVDVASVGQTESGPEIVRTTIGGRATTLPQPDGRATTIVGGSGGSLLLRMSNGQVLQSTGGGWEPTGVTASVLGTQR